MSAKRKLLILNDDPDLVEMMMSILIDAGYDTKASVVRDLELVIHEEPHAVLLDCPPGEEKEILGFAQKMRLTPKIAKVPILIGTSSMRHIEPSKVWTTFELSIHRGIALVHDTKNTRFAMLSLSPDRTALVLHAKDERPEVVYTAPERIEKISVCPNSGLAVMLTVHKKVIFYMVPERALRAVLHGEGADDAIA